MKIALCNEVLRELAFPAQCEQAAALGYGGLELAPFTLGEEPHRLSADRRAQLRRAASDAGIAITGLHWLLLTPPGLSITAADPGVRKTTVDILQRLIDLCADLGRCEQAENQEGRLAPAFQESRQGLWFVGHRLRPR